MPAKFGDFRDANFLIVNTIEQSEFLNTRTTGVLHMPISIKRDNFDPLYLSTCQGRKDNDAKLKLNANRSSID